MSSSSSSTPMARCSTCTRRLRAFAQQAGPDADRMSEIWRGKQLEYTWTLTLAGHYVDFWTLTERALDYALARVPSVPKALKPKLLDAYFKLDAFPDARAALRALKAKGHKTGILSNGSPNMLKGAVDAAGIGGDLDAVLSVDVLKMFKPRPEVYRPRHRSLQMRARRRDVRVVQPLGRDGGRVGRLPRPVGQPQQDAGRISRFSAAADAERSQLIGDFRLSALATGLARVGAAAYMRCIRHGPPIHAIDHFHRQSVEDLRVRLPGAEEHQSRHPPRRDLRAARPERRRQDHADQHRLRHRQCQRRARSRSTATTSSTTTAPRAR